jgi:hypothetical protein
MKNHSKDSRCASHNSDLGIERRILLIWILRNCCEGMDWNWLAQDWVWLVVSSFEHVDEPLGSTKGREFF